MILISGSRLKALTRFAADQDVRYYLNGIFFDPTGYAVATDGHALLAIQTMSFKGDGFIAPLAAVKAALATKKGMAQYRYTFGIAADAIDGKPFKAIDGNYPDWKKVVPLKVSGELAEYDPRLLEKCRRAIEDLKEGDRCDALLIAHNGAKDKMPALIQTKFPDALMLVCPWQCAADLRVVAEQAAAFMDITKKAKKS